MIDLKKEYKTTDGNAVKLFEIHEDKVIGMVIFQVTSPYPTLWELNGKHISDWKQFDLVEVRKPIEHSAWVNVYEWGFSRYTFTTKEAADEDAQDGVLDCIEVNYSSVK
jgi:hypothetical protein